MKSKTTKTTKSTPTKRGVPPKVEVDSNSSVQVRKIENGFIVSESGTIGKGRNQNYYNKEYFSPGNPIQGITKPVKFGKK